MKFQIKSRWDSSKVLFEADIECSADASEGVKLGLAVRAAVKARANLAGAYLTRAYLTGANLTGANLTDANLADANLADANLADANLAGAYLTRANLAGAYLTRANLAGADLTGANLAGADLRECPAKIESIHQKVYAAASAPGALNMGSWHETDACGTTHCRAGWVVHLAGEAGRALEWAMGTSAAATVIYMASDPKLEKIPNFYCDDDAALEDMKRLAEAEAASVEATCGER